MDENAANFAVHQVVSALAVERSRQGLSKNHVAQIAGLDPKTVALVESGRRSPTLYTVFRLCAALNCDLWHILESIDQTPGKKSRLKPARTNASLT